MDRLCVCCVCCVCVCVLCCCVVLYWCGLAGSAAVSGDASSRAEEEEGNKTPETQKNSFCQRKKPVAKFHPFRFVFSRGKKPIPDERRVCVCACVHVCVSCFLQRKKFKLPSASALLSSTQSVVTRHDDDAPVTVDAPGMKYNRVAPPADHIVKKKENFTVFRPHFFGPKREKEKCFRRKKMCLVLVFKPCILSWKDGSWSRWRRWRWRWWWWWRALCITCFFSKLHLDSVPIGLTGCHSVSVSCNNL